MTNINRTGLIKTGKFIQMSNSPVSGIHNVLKMEIYIDSINREEFDCLNV